jgi:hypothetical protein
MESIKFYLAKYENQVPPLIVLRRRLRELVAERYHYTLPDEAISLSGRTIYLKVPPALKSEIFIHRQAIIEQLLGAAPGLREII